jgi:hypothetical protein
MEGFVDTTKHDKCMRDDMIEFNRNWLRAELSNLRHDEMLVEVIRWMKFWAGYSQAPTERPEQ